MAEPQAELERTQEEEAKPAADAPNPFYSLARATLGASGLPGLRNEPAGFKYASHPELAAKRAEEVRAKQRAAAAGQEEVRLTLVPAKAALPAGVLAGTLAALHAEQPWVAEEIYQLGNEYPALINRAAPIIERGQEMGGDASASESLSRTSAIRYADEIGSKNLWDGEHLSFWLDRMNDALTHLGGVFERVGTADPAVRRTISSLDRQRGDMLGRVKLLRESPFIVKGAFARERAETLASRRKQIADAARDIVELAAEHWSKDLDDNQMGLFGLLAAQRIVLRHGLRTTPEVKAVLDTTRQWGWQVPDMVLFRGGTVKALLGYGIGGLQEYRAEGEGFWSGMIRGERELTIADPIKRTRMTGSAKIFASLGFTIGAPEGIQASVKANLEGLVTLPAQLPELYKFFTEFLPNFILDDALRFRLGQMLGEAGLESEREMERLASVDPVEYGRTLGYMFGYVLTELILSAVGLGWLLEGAKAGLQVVTKSETVVKLANWAKDAALLQKPLKWTETLAGALAALQRRIAILDMKFQRLTAVLGREARQAYLAERIADAEQALKIVQRFDSIDPKILELKKLEFAAQNAITKGDQHEVEKLAGELKAAADDAEKEILLLERRMGEAGEPGKVPEPDKKPAGHAITKESPSAAVQKAAKEDQVVKMADAVPGAGTAAARLQKARTRLAALGMDADAIARVIGKGPIVDHIKGQLLEELLEIRVKKMLTTPEGRAALAGAEKSQKLQFIGGHRITDAGGAQLGDGMLAIVEGDYVRPIRWFESKAGEASRARLATHRARFSKIGKEELGWLKLEAIDELARRRGLPTEPPVSRAEALAQAAKRKKLAAEHEKEIQALMEEMYQISESGQARKTIERGSPDVDPKTGADIPATIKIDGKEMKVVGEFPTEGEKLKGMPQSTPVTGVTPSDVSPGRLKKTIETEVFEIRDPAGGKSKKVKMPSGLSFDVMLIDIKADDLVEISEIVRAAFGLT